LNEALIILIGFTVPFFLSGTYFFWNDQFLWFWQNQFTENLGFLDFDLNHNWETYSKLGFFALLFLITFLSSGSYTFKKNLQVQKFISILYLALLFGGLSIFIQAGIRLEHLLLFVAPLSIFLSFNLQNMRSSFAEAFHLLLLIGIIILQFKVYWA
jgi:hypothetical protein